MLAALWRNASLYAKLLALGLYGIVTGKPVFAGQADQPEKDPPQILK